MNRGSRLRGTWDPYDDGTSFRARLPATPVLREMVKCVNLFRDVGIDFELCVNTGSGMRRQEIAAIRWAGLDSPRRRGGVARREERGEDRPGERYALFRGISRPVWIICETT